MAGPAGYTNGKPTVPYVFPSFCAVEKGAHNRVVVVTVLGNSFINCMIKHGDMIQ